MIPSFINPEYVARQIGRLESTDGAQSDNHLYNIASHADLTRHENFLLMTSEEKSRTRAFIREFKRTV